MQDPKNNVVLVGKVLHIELTQGQTALADLDDLELVAPHRWCAKWDSRGRTFYAVTNVWVTPTHLHRCFPMHRMIMGLEWGDKRHVDHVHHQTLDNRRSELRVVTNRQNQWNQRRSQSSEFPGVYWNKRSSKWVAKVYAAGRHRYLGSFEDEKVAAEAYQEALRAL